MRIIEGIDPIYEVDKYDVVLVGTSIYDILANGFQFKIANKFPYVAEENHKQPYGDLRRLGTRLTLENKDCPIISLLYICGFPKKGLKSLNYEALENCLRTASAEFKNKRIITTVVGSTAFDGEGDKDKILRIMGDIFENSDIDVYDYIQERGETLHWGTARKLKAMGVDRAKRKEVLKNLYLIPSNA